MIFQAANQMHGMKNVGDVPAVYHVMRWNSPGMLKARANRVSSGGQAFAVAPTASLSQLVSWVWGT